MIPVPDSIKDALRLLEARFTPRRGRLAWNGTPLRVVRSLWWDESSQAYFDAEIAPYFAPLPPAAGYSVIIDAGAASGLFALAAAVSYPAARVAAFEPSRRQRTVLDRNLRLNGLADRVRIVPAGLWDRREELAFRTHGAISSLQAAGQFSPEYPFRETIPVIPLDQWVNDHRPGRVGLIKMDIEGAELEALRGAGETLKRDRPDLLVQAYHRRDGSRTFERCAAFLQEKGYACRECGTQTGMLYATPAP